MIERLIHHAEAQGINVAWHLGGPKGAWLPNKRLISLRIGMTDTQTACTLAHELGHAYYDDPEGHAPKLELRADKYAAQLLISPSEYAAAESLYGTHPAIIARELGVTTHLIHVWQLQHERTTPR